MARVGSSLQISLPGLTGQSDTRDGRIPSKSRGVPDAPRSRGTTGNVAANYFAMLQSGRIAPETSMNAPSTSSATNRRL